MRIADLISLILFNLGRRKGRVMLTAVGVVIGTAAVVVLVSLAVGLQKNATEQLWGINDLSRIEVYPNYSYEMEPKVMGGGGGGGSNVSGTLLTPDAIKQIKELPGAEVAVIHEYLNASMELVFGKLHGYGGITGVDITDLSHLGLQAARGSTELHKGSIVVGANFPRNFYNPQARPDDPPLEPPDLLDQTVKLVLMKWTQDGQEVRKTVNIKVSGILAETKGSEDYSIYMSLDEVTAFNEWSLGRRINRNKDGYAMLIVRATGPDVVLDVADQITALGFQAYTPQTAVEGINSFFTIMQIIFGGVGAIALLVAAIGIANTMAMAILERTREIGIMKAIGATNHNILSIFLGEAAGIGFIGGLGGVGLGWGVSAVLNVLVKSYFAGQAASGGSIPPSVVTATPFWLPIFTLVFATVIGLISGLYPALRAATLVPVDALKYE